MFHKLTGKIKYKLLLSMMKPEMLSYRSIGGAIVKGTRVSNMTHLSNKSNLSIGENVFIGHFNYIDGFCEVRIGEGCQITNYVSILTHSSHNALRLYGPHYIEHQSSQMPGIEKGSVSIGEYTFVGAHSVIMPGTKIGKGCIISAYTFISGNVADFSVVRGIPGKVVGDTRKLDKALLNEHPELSQFYWNKEVLDSLGQIK
jgi:acetyltransferase-like isoleucine patch superfamily enzyme